MPLRTDAVSLVPLGRRTLAIHRPTGAWAYLDDREKRLFQALDGSTLAGVVAGNPSAGPWITAATEFLWSRGLVSASGNRALEGPDLDRDIDEAARQAFALLLVMSSVCPLACRYCYLRGHGHLPRARMALDTGLDAIGRALDRDEARLLIDFGEIVGSETLFRSLVEGSKARAERRGRDPSLLIQTSGVRIEPEMADFLVLHGVSVGLSLDGPERLHDKARQFPSGGGTHAASARTLDLLVQRGIHHWVFATIGRHNVDEPEVVLSHFHDLHAAGIVFKAVQPVGAALEHWPEVGVTQEEYANFVSTAVRFAVRRGVDSLDIGHRMATLRALGDRRGWGKACPSRGCHCGEQYVVVAPDGMWTPCPRFSGLRENPAGIPVRRRPRGIGVEVPSETARIPPRCHECPWVRFCGGGCAFSGPEDPQCESYRASYQAIFEVVIPALAESRDLDSSFAGPLRLVSHDSPATPVG